MYVILRVRESLTPHDRQATCLDYGTTLLMSTKKKVAVLHADLP